VIVGVCCYVLANGTEFHVFGPGERCTCGQRQSAARIEVRPTLRLVGESTSKPEVEGDG
jgi:hypothetical protein